MSEELAKLIKIITTGTAVEVKNAQKRIERIWNQSCRDMEKRRMFSVFLEAARDFDKIPDVEHQAYFINTLKWAFYFALPETFPIWTELLIGWVQHPDGKIRIAAVRAAQYLSDTMESDSEDRPDRPHQYSPETKQFAKDCFCIFALRADQLITKYHKPAFNKYRYISSLPAGIYKSAQQLLHESILTCPRFERMYDEFLDKMNRKAAPDSHQQLLGHA